MFVDKVDRLVSGDEQRYEVAGNNAAKLKSIDGKQIRRARKDLRKTANVDLRFGKVKNEILTFGLLYNGGSFAKLGYFITVCLVAAANKDEEFYLNYKEASGTKRRSQTSAGG